MTKAKSPLPAYLDLYTEALSAYTKAVLGANELMLGYSSAMFRTLLTPVAPARGSHVPSGLAVATSALEPVAASATKVDAEPAPSEHVVRAGAAPARVRRRPKAAAPEQRTTKAGKATGRRKK